MNPTDLVAQTAQVSLSLFDQFSKVFSIWGYLLQYSPYWAPPILVVIFARVWLDYVRARFIGSQENVLLEIRLPQEVFKSPAAMQAVFDGLYMRGGETTFIDRLWLGKVRMWYSFEFVSLEGQVHMYVWVRKSFRKMVERTFYAHYPDIEIIEAEDYSIMLPFSLERYNLYGMDFMLGAAVGVPIRTYIDYKLDQSNTKEEQKTDPIAHMFELLGSMQKGEYIWVQILARGHKKEDLTYGRYNNIKSYEEVAKEEIARIRKNPEEVVIFPDGGQGKTLSDRQMVRIKAMNRTMLSSTHWDVGIRGIYLAEHEHFDGTNITGLRTVWQPFGAPGYNSIKSVGNRWQDILDYPWQDFNGYRENKKKIQIVDAYRRRSWFHLPYRFPHYMMTSEELATLFHIPGSVVRTPNVQRISSTRAQAPPNLPV